MPAESNALKRQLARTREIELTVTGRKSGRAISNPVWFVLDGERLYLLPVHGSETQWYRNVLENPSIRVRAGATEKDLTAVTITDPAQVSSAVDRLSAPPNDEE